MKLNKCRLGDIITQRREKYNGEDIPICGVTREGFIPPKQKDADTSLYNVFYLKDFVFNPARMELNSIVFNDMYTKATCSSLYEVFYVNKPDMVLPEYLALLVKQDWFTRYCEFLGSGSAREYCRVANISEIEIEYPSIDTQRQIVNEYAVLKERIKIKKQINDNLAETLDTLFCNLYQGIDDDHAVSFNEVCSLASSKRVFAEDYVSEGIPFYRGKEISQKRNGEPISEPLYISSEYYDTLKTNYGVPIYGDILITAVGTIGNSYFVQDEDFYFKDGNIIWLKDFHVSGINYYLYDYMQTSIFERELEGICIGSTQTALTIVALSKLKVKVPERFVLSAYCAKSKVIRQSIQSNNAEIAQLTITAQSILASLSR